MKWTKTILLIVLTILSCLLVVPTHAVLCPVSLSQTLPSACIDSNGIEFVLIPAGSFRMGCTGFEECDSDEEP